MWGPPHAATFGGEDELARAPIAHLQRGVANRWRSMVCIGPWSAKQMRESPGRRHVRSSHRNPNRNQLRSSFFQPSNVCVPKLMGRQKWDGERMRVSPQSHLRLLTAGTLPFDIRRRNPTQSPYPRCRLQQSTYASSWAAESDPEMWLGRSVAERGVKVRGGGEKGPPARRRWSFVRFLRARRSPRSKTKISPWTPLSDRHQKLLNSP